MASGREPLRIPQSWKDQARAFVIQLERILDNIFHRADDNEKNIKANAERIEEVNDSKLSLTGGVMTGGISYNHQSVDASKADNNISAAVYPTLFNIRDKSSRILARTEGRIYPNGDVSYSFYIRNYNTSGESIGQKGMSVTESKSGDVTWSVSEKDKFRRAIEGAHMGSVAILANGDTHVAISLGDYVYVMANTHGLSDGLYKATAAVAANGSISSSNMVAHTKGIGNSLQKMIMSDWLANGTDLNTVNTPGFYGLSSTSTFTNMPSGAAALLVCRCAYSANAVLQVAYGTYRCYLRFRTSATDWSAWRKIDNYGYGWQGSCDVDTLTAPGTYGLDSSYSYTHLPSGVTSGILEVIVPSTSTSWIMQRLLTVSYMYVRYRNQSSGTAWGSWYRYSGTVVT